MSTTTADPAMVAYCGLYCGACGAHARQRCSGCHENHRATWCKVRSCCMEHDYQTCADCSEYADPKACRKYNNLLARLVGIVLRSDRAACIAQIRRIGLQAHAETMAAQGRQSLRRGAAQAPS